mgnify:CR=1 FL=1
MRMADSQPEDSTTNPDYSPESDAGDAGLKEEQGSDTSHIDDLLRERFGKAGTDDDQAEAEGDTGGVEDHLITYDQFHRQFCKAHHFLGWITGYDTLKHVDENGEAPAQASFAAYSEILRAPSLHWILNPLNERLQNAFVIGSWFFGIAAGCRAEKQAAQEQAEAEREEQGHAAPDRDRQPEAEPQPSSGGGKQVPAVNLRG